MCYIMLRQMINIIFRCAEIFEFYYYYYYIIVVVPHAPGRLDLDDRGSLGLINIIL